MISFRFQRLIEKLLSVKFVIFVSSLFLDLEKEIAVSGNAKVCNFPIVITVGDVLDAAFKVGLCKCAFG